MTTNPTFLSVEQISVATYLQLQNLENMLKNNPTLIEQQANIRTIIFHSQQEGHSPRYRYGILITCHSKQLLLGLIQDGRERMAVEVDLHYTFKRKEFVDTLTWTDDVDCVAAIASLMALLPVNHTPLHTNALRLPKTSIPALLQHYTTYN